MRTYIFLLLAASLMGCATTSNRASLPERTERHGVVRQEVPVATDLTQYLMRITGVNVIGTGVNAQVTIRMPTSFVDAAQFPLYVIDGNPFGNSYQAVFNYVNPLDIERVRVLKNADELSQYGVRGAAGVIEITLRKE